MSRHDRLGGRVPLGRTPRAIALAAICALLAAGCGARWDDDQRAAVEARYAGGGGNGTTQEVASGDTTTGSSGDTTTGDASTSRGGSTSSGGTGGATSSGGGAGPASSASKPCAAKSTAPGVTDDTITVGSISSLSGPVPGIGSTAAAAARAYVAYLNANNGVCGRKVVLKEADDGTDNGRYRSVLNELGPQVFGLAGGFGAGDVGAVEVFKQQKLPAVITPSGQTVADVANVFDINPKFANERAVTAKYKYIKQQGASSVALVYLAIDQSRAEARTQRNLMEAAGIKVVLQEEVPIQTLSFDSTARKVANSKASYLFFIGDPNSNASMTRAMHGTGYQLKHQEMFTLTYGTNFIERAGGDAAEGTVSWLRSLPNEEAGSNAALATFNEWMGRAAPGLAKDPFAVDSWAATKAFFDGLAALPGAITREALVAQLAKIGTYDAGGFFGPIQFGREITNGCYVAVKVVGGKWKRLTPAKGFLC